MQPLHDYKLSIRRPGCCWCNGKFGSEHACPTRRSVHRTQCSLRVLEKLKNNPNDSYCINTLNEIWSSLSLPSHSDSPRKRDREQLHCATRQKCSGYGLCEQQSWRQVGCGVGELGTSEVLCGQLSHNLKDRFEYNDPPPTGRALAAQQYRSITRSFEVTFVEEELSK
jgi:hypothetical protein